MMSAGWRRIVAVLLCASLAAGQQDEKKLSSSDKDAPNAIASSRMGSFVYKNRWQNHAASHHQHHSHNQPSSSLETGDINSIDDFGDLSSSSSSSSSSTSAANTQLVGAQDQGQYACGRPLTNKKHLTLEREQQFFGSQAGSRTKYRPFEIRMPRIIGGDETNPGEFPWTVSVKLNGQPICGGSLIDESWILTAAHCVVGYNPRNLTVRLGAYRIKDTSETQTIESALSLFIVHKEYSMPRPFSNDIALLKMAEPVRYSDFIIPICLPTEDSGTGSDILSDFLGSNNNNNKMSPSGSEFHDADESSPYHSRQQAHKQQQHQSSSGGLPSLNGIVISASMSDKEISRCFKRLEQNYLNSIGLGSTSSASGGSSSDLPVAEDAPAVVLAPTGSSISTATSGGAHKYHYNHYESMPPMPVDLLPALSMGASTPAHGSVPAKLKGGESSSSSTLLEDVRPPVYAQQQQNNNNNNNKISFASLLSGGEIQHLGEDLDSAEYSSANQLSMGPAQQTFATITNNQHQQNQRNRLSNHNANSYAHYGAPMWEGAREGRAVMADGAELSGAGESSRAAPLAGQPTSLSHLYAMDPQRTATIKLTSLPISKELLREIQSVGSMQSLSLGLQQGDIVAMASDLAPTNSIGISTAASPASSLAAVALPTGNTNNRERVITTSGAESNSQNTRQPLRNPVRVVDPTSTNDLGDGSDETSGGQSQGSRYSGLSGIVVGWGWVRENDNDDQVGSTTTSGKGFQSVTLQKVRLPILRNNECEAWFRSQEKKITLLPSQFCAGFNLGGKDACRGDSGGPMIIEDNSETGRYKLIGIVSAGIGCARPSLPGLYTRVASFLPWINAQMTRY